MRFVVFAGKKYYPHGGAEDFHGSHEDEVDAVAAIFGLDAEDWAHVWDTYDFKIVSSWIRATDGVEPEGWCTEGEYEERLYEYLEKRRKPVCPTCGLIGEGVHMNARCAP